MSQEKTTNVLPVSPTVSSETRLVCYQFDFEMQLMKLAERLPK